VFADPLSGASTRRWPILVLGLLAAGAGADVPMAPQAQLAPGPDGQVVLSWTPVAGARHYVIYRQDEPYGPLQELALVEEGPYLPGLGTGRAFFRVTAVGDAPGWPLRPAPTPSHASGEVVSLFSDSYPAVPVDTWSAPWDQADVQDVLIDGDQTKLFTNLTFSGTEFVTHAIDATTLTHFHFDLWTPDPTDPPATFRVKLVDFGADGQYGGGNDSESELAIDRGWNPPLASGEWLGYTIPLQQFGGLASRAHLAQLLFSGEPDSVFVDNIYFLRDSSWTPPTEPQIPAPTPGRDPSRVLSLFSDVYGNLPVDTWSAVWDQAEVEEGQLSGDRVLRYSGLGYAGIECVSQPVDAGSMTHLHLDIWTAGPTAPPAELRVKLVDFGANGVWDGGGDDREHELAFHAQTNPALPAGSWAGLDIPLAAFTGLTTRRHLAQIILSGSLDPIWLDNLYLYNSCPPWTPPAVAGSTEPGDGDAGARDLQVVWEDTFDGPAGQTPDPLKWDFDIGTGWGNAQLEYDTGRPANASLDGAGCLAITARREDYLGSAYTSARIVTRGRFEPTGGRVEARMQLPVGQGIWPAFWLLGANIGQVGWPQCGEIDIMEARGQLPDQNLGSLHGPGYSGGASHSHLFQLPGEGFHQDFHIFAVDWGADAIEWFVDGQSYGSAQPDDLPGPWVFNHPFYIILNLAVGGSFVGPPDECTIFPQTLRVDWVRVLQETDGRGAADGAPAEGSSSGKMPERSPEP